MKASLKTLDPEEVVNLKGSPNIKELIKDSITESLTGKQSKNKSILSSTTPKPKVKPKVAKKPKSMAMSTMQAIHKSNLPQLKDTKGRFTSPTSIMNLMNTMMHDAVRENMHRPNLEYQTGRFARSVEVKGITRARDGALTAYLSYMRYPYATFERGGAQGHKGYYPSRLILQSARDVAAKLTRERFQAVMVK